MNISYGPSYEFHLTLVRSPKDDPFFGLGCQQDVIRFYIRVRGNRTKIRPIAFGVDSIGIKSGFSGEFVLTIGELVRPTLRVAAGIWLLGRAGRKVILKVRNIEMNAEGPEEFDRILTQALTLPSLDDGSESRLGSS